MEFIAILFALAVAAVFAIAPIVSLVLGFQARGRLRELERQNDELWTDLRGLRRAHEESKKRADALAAQLKALGAEVAARPAASVAAPPQEAVAVTTAAEPEAVSVAPAPVEAAAPVMPVAPAETPALAAQEAPAQDAAPSPVPAPEPAPAPAQAPSPPPRAPTPPPRAPAPPPAPIPFERLAIWTLAGLGGLGVVVAALFFYDLAVERGLITPAIRFALGLVAGTGMIVGAEVLWRKDYRIPAAAVQGAGLGVLYAALYAGYSRYELLPNLLTLALMGGVTIASAAFAIRHASLFLAILGAIGGYLTPVMLSTGDNKAVALFTYIALLDIGLLWVATRRRWASLVAFAGFCTLALQVGWGASYRELSQLPISLVAAAVLGGLFVARAVRDEGEGLGNVRLVAGIASLGLLLGPLPFLAPPEGLASAPDMAGAAAGAGALWLLVSHGVTFAVAARGGHRWMPPLVAIVGSLPQLVFSFAWADHDPAPMAAVAVAVVGVALLGLVTSRRADEPHLGGGAISLGLLLWLGALSLNGPSEPIPGGLPIAVLGLGALVAMCLVSPVLGGATWTPLAGLTGAALGVGGVLSSRLLEGDQPLTLLALAGLFYAAFAVYPFMVRAWGPDAEQPAPTAPWLAAGLAGPALFYPMYDAWEQGLGESAIGLLPVLLAVGSIASVTALVRRWRATSSDRNLALFAGVALLFLTGAVPVQLSNEWLTLGWALEAGALAWMSGRLSHPLVRPTSLVLIGLVAVRLLFNPDALDYHAAVGPPIFNWILYTWGVPALVALYMARRYHEVLPKVSLGLLLLSIALFFALLNLEVSHAFADGASMQVTSRTFEEGMVRSLSWAAFGIALLVIGVRTRGRVLRFLSVGFLLLAAAKVGLVDLWSLGGMARVGSLLGLGVFLLVGALLFRRLEIDLAAERPDGEG